MNSHFVPLSSSSSNSNNSQKTSLKERMKLHGKHMQNYASPAIPLVLKISGKNFSLLTEELEKPYCPHFMKCMIGTAQDLMSGMLNACFGYVFQDEINIVLMRRNEKDSSWYEGNLNKIISNTASRAAFNFMDIWFSNDYFAGQSPDEAKEPTLISDKGNLFQPHFEITPYQIPTEDIVNFFIERQDEAHKKAYQQICLNYTSMSENDLRNLSVQELRKILSKHNISPDTIIPNNEGQIYFNGLVLYKPSSPEEQKKLLSSFKTKEAPIFKKDKLFVARQIPGVYKNFQGSKNNN